MFSIGIICTLHFNYFYLYCVVVDKQFSFNIVNSMPNYENELASFILISLFGLLPARFHVSNDSPFNRGLPRLLWYGVFEE